MSCCSRLCIDLLALIATSTTANLQSPYAHLGIATAAVTFAGMTVGVIMSACSAHLKRCCTPWLILEGRLIPGSTVKTILAD